MARGFAFAEFIFPRIPELGSHIVQLGKLLTFFLYIMEKLLRERKEERHNQITKEDPDSMITKTRFDQLQKPSIAFRPKSHIPAQWLDLLIYAIFGGMVASLLLLGTVLPLQELKYSDALLTQLGSWPIILTRFLFHQAAVISPLPRRHPMLDPLTLTIGWEDAELLFTVFCIVFLWYVLALRFLPRHISFRSILLSTLLLGLICVLIPVATSTDLFSYIAYARIGVIYHLNPLTTIPMAIRTDPIYAHVYWERQPSIYGPTWIMFICLMQWLMLTLHFHDILSMVLGLRAVGLTMHLASTWLIYSISWRLQIPSYTLTPERRLRAALAFAWNPLLLLEACMNAHYDTTLLFLLLLSLWFLVCRQVTVRASVGAMLIFAVATCLKVNVALFIPGMLLFLWKQPNNNRGRLHLMSLVVAIVTYVGVIIAFYAPFWQGGAVLAALRVNPGTYRNINTLADFLSRFYNTLAHTPGYLASPSSVTSSPPQQVAHILSVSLFVILYALLSWWWATRAPWNFNTFPGLLRWLALVWLLYCAIGSPWFWPWYSIIFFGLYALIEATGTRDTVAFGLVRLPMAVRLLAFSMLSLYWFFAGAPGLFFVPGLPGLRWAYLSGLWAWSLPLLALWPPLANLREAAQPLLYHLANVLHWEKLRAWIQ